MSEVKAYWPYYSASLLLVLVLFHALWFVWNNRDQKDQKKRSIRAVAAAVIIPIAAMLWMFSDFSAKDHAAFYWILISFFQFLICAFLAQQHILQMKKDAADYYQSFSEKPSPQTCDAPSSETWSSIEGQSSFVIIVWGIYGLAALLGSVITYFVLAQAWTPDAFIFRNNEGFIAALTLLIIVVSGAAVPIYTDLAKQVRSQIDDFELEISNLHRAVINVSDHANPLWSHIISVSRAAIQTWTRRLTRDQIERATYDVLFKPFWLLAQSESLNQVPDDYLLRYQETEVRARHRKVPWENLRGFRESYLASPDLRQSTDRILDNQLFQMSRLVTNGSETLVRETGNELTYADRLLRIRRLRYLGWMAQGRLARATTVRDDGQLRLGPTLDDAHPLFIAHPWTDPGVGAVDVSSAGLRLVPSSEHFMVELLRNSQDVPLDADEKDKKDQKKNDLEELSAEYRERATRHIARWTETLRPALVNACNPLDLDIAPLADDMSLLEHLTVEKAHYPTGTLARFFYYGVWLTEVAEPNSRIFAILAVLDPSMAGQVDGQHLVADASDIRRRWMSLAQAVRGYVDGSVINEQDPIADEVRISQNLAYEHLVDYMNISGKWLEAVRALPGDPARLAESTGQKQIKFLRWIVRVLGAPDDKVGLDELENAALVSLACRLVSPRVRHWHAQRETPEDQRFELSEGSHLAQFNEVMNTVYEHCRDANNRNDLLITFFDPDENGARTDQEQRCDNWIGGLKPWIELNAEETTKNLTKEFLLLSLADHKSALFNWMRASRAVEIRERVTSFQNALLQQRATARRQLGIEIIPSRHDRLIHLRTYLRFTGYQKPLQVRSIYDLEPTPVVRAAGRNRKRKHIYSPYLRLVDILDVSQGWAKGVRISEAIQDWVRQNVYGPADVHVRLDHDLRPPQVNLLTWIVRVLGTAEDQQRLSNIENGDLVLLAFKLVNPHISHRLDQSALPDVQRTELSDEQYQAQLDDLMDRVERYCRNPENEVDMQNTFFAGSNRGTSAQAPETYRRWLGAKFPRD